MRQMVSICFSTFLPWLQSVQIPPQNRLQRYITCLKNANLQPKLFFDIFLPLDPNLPNDWFETLRCEVCVGLREVS